MSTVGSNAGMASAKKSSDAFKIGRVASLRPMSTTQAPKMLIIPGAGPTVMYAGMAKADTVPPYIMPRRKSSIKCSLPVLISRFAAYLRRANDESVVRGRAEHARRN